MSAIDPQYLPSARLENALRYLIKQQHSNEPTCQCGNHRHTEYILESDTWSQLEALQRLLCIRPATPQLPPEILDDIEAVIAYRNSHALMKSATTITPTVILQHQSLNSSSITVSCWRGDITVLTDVTAIVNAANGQLQGCFRPEHRCIDNVIHSAAGPRLRDACHSIIESQGRIEPVGSAKVTPGFLLPAQWVLHTVGPQLQPRQKPQPHHKAQLASCYRSCLDATESLPPRADGRKVVAFCCISTGLFAFPSDLAAEIAVDTVISWYMENTETTITDIIFDTFLEKDYSIYEAILSRPQCSISNNSNLVRKTPLPSPSAPSYNLFPSPAVEQARTWIEEASHLIISAGAGLSAATGLDYTSTELFDRNFSAFKSKGLRRLYDVFGFDGWDSPAQKWGYYILHLNMVRSWPVSPAYGTLLDLVNKFPSNFFVRTTNADNFFEKNGFDPNRISTPQGSYRFLQCYNKCRVDAVFSSDTIVDAALPHIDPVTGLLMDETKIPHCRFCGGELTLCVRGGNYFNSAPFREQNMKWEQFLKNTEEDVSLADDESGRIVILELGVGLNTPGVLRWPNEELVCESRNRAFRLIRVGMAASGCVPWALEDKGLAVGISGEINTALNLLLK